MRLLSYYKKLNDALYLLHDCEDPDVEIVFFHGVAPKHYELLYRTDWMTRSGTECWPAAWLPKEKKLARAKIFSATYDSSAEKTDDHGRFTMTTVDGYLAYNLTEKIGQRGIPVILVGHDLGGLVIKQLCLYLVKEVALDDQNKIYGGASTSKSEKFNDFLDNVTGIFYFATPHQGLKFDADGSQHNGGLVSSLKIHSASTAQLNNDFRILRARRKWPARGLGPANKDTKEPFQLEEASARYDTDDFFMVPESTGSITKPDSRASTSFQFFVQSMNTFLTSFYDWQPQFDEDSLLFKETVGLEQAVTAILDDLSRQQKANAGTSAVVLHGMGGIGKSTLGNALFECLGNTRPRLYKIPLFIFDREPTRSNPTGVRRLQSQLSSIFRKGKAAITPTYSNKNLRLMKRFKQQKRRGRPLLIFIDNVQEEEELTHLLPKNIRKGLPRGSHIIVATRNSRVGQTLRDMGLPHLKLYEMQEMCPLTAQSLFCKHAFRDAEVTVPLELVQSITEACGGLPLALEVVGRHLRFGIGNQSYGDDSWKLKWIRARHALKNWISVRGSKEDRLQQCLEFSYHNLSPELQLAFLDIAVCFNGSPWNELRTMYGAELIMLKERALIKEGTAMAGGSKYSYVQVHALFVSLARKLGSDSGSHFIKTIDGTNTKFDLEDIPSHKDCGNQGIALVLRGSKLPSPVKSFSYASVFLWILDSVIQNCIYPKLSAVEAVSLPVRHLERIAQSVRILILTNIRVEGTLASENLPGNLMCLACVNSTVPLSGAHFGNLRKLIVVDVTSPIHGNGTYSFPPGLRRLRLESASMEMLRFKGRDLEEFAVMSTKPFHARCEDNELLRLRKWIIRDTSVKELPLMIPEAEAVEFLSIQGCENLTLLPENLDRLRMLRHLHISLKNLKRLPESTSNMTNLQTLTLENCAALEQVPAELGHTRILKVLAIKGCSTLRSLPGSFLETFQNLQNGYCDGGGKSPPSGQMLQTKDWLIFHRDVAEGLDKLVQEALNGRHMRSVLLKPTDNTGDNTDGSLGVYLPPFSIYFPIVKYIKNPSWLYMSPVCTKRMREFHCREATS